MFTDAYATKRLSPLKRGSRQSVVSQLGKWRLRSKLPPVRLIRTDRQNGVIW